MRCTNLAVHSHKACWMVICHKVIGGENQAPKSYSVFSCPFRPTRFSFDSSTVLNRHSTYPPATWLMWTSLKAILNILKRLMLNIPNLLGQWWRQYMTVTSEVTNNRKRLTHCILFVCRTSSLNANTPIAIHFSIIYSASLKYGNHIYIIAG